MGVRVMIIDPSGVAQAVVRAALELERDIEVVGVASDGAEVDHRIDVLYPDVIVLDAGLLERASLSLLSDLTARRSAPVVMVRAVGRELDEIDAEAHRRGASACVIKPMSTSGGDVVGAAARLRAAVREAASTVRQRLREAARQGGFKPREPLIRDSLQSCALVAFGASTGGVEALQQVLRGLPRQFPPVVLVQHMSTSFLPAFTRRLGAVTGRPCLEAVDGAVLQRDHVYVGTGHRHLTVQRREPLLQIRLLDDDPVGGHRPSVDVLFTSVAGAVGRQAVGVVLTGMGSDGAAGLEAISRAHGYTIAQDEATSVVWGMPGAAVRRGAAQMLVPLGAIAEVVTRCVQQLERRVV